MISSLRTTTLRFLFMGLYVLSAVGFSFVSFLPGLATESPQGNLTLTGRYRFYNRGGTQFLSERLLVQIVRADSNAVLAECYTGIDGRFSCGPFTNPMVAVKAVFLSYTSLPPYNDILVTVDPGRGTTAEKSNAFRWTSSSNVYPDGVYDVGSWNVPHGHNSEGAFWILHDLIRTWRFVYDNAGASLSPQETTGPATVQWSRSSTDGPYYTPGGNIHLAGEDADSPTVTPHLYGFNILYNAYGSLPVQACPLPEKSNVTLDSQPVCAWRDGWGIFLSLAGNHSSTYTWGNGDSLDLETPGWGTSGWGTGDAIVGRVAGALWDIYDAAVDGDDQYGEPGAMSRIWNVIYHQNPATLDDFWDGWRTAGFDNSSAGPIMSLFQNTVNYRTGPANDDFSGAVVVSQLPFTITGLNTANATTQGNDPGLSCGSPAVPIGSRSVWYRFTPVASGIYTISTAGSNYDTVLSLWGGTFGSLQSHSCDNDGGSGSQSLLVANITAGGTYYIEITQYGSGAGGLLDLSITKTGNQFNVFIPLIR